jgi:hypothetical protein
LEGGLLAHALDLGERLLVAFNTPTGLPYPKVLFLFVLLMFFLYMLDLNIFK